MNAEKALFVLLCCWLACCWCCYRYFVYSSPWVVVLVLVLALALVGAVAVVVTAGVVPVVLTLEILHGVW